LDGGKQLPRSARSRRCYAILAVPRGLERHNDFNGLQIGSPGLVLRMFPMCPYEFGEPIQE
jgi:hypothetical protein